MIKIEKVLFCTDFSEDSAYALPYATEVAEKFGAKLYVLHVIDNPMISIYGEPHGDHRAIEANARNKAREMMNRYDALLRDFANREILIKEGDAAEKILEAVKEKNIDMLVLGTHGGGVLRHFMLGSTTRKLLGSVHCPVLAVRHPECPSAAKHHHHLGSTII